MRDVIGLGDIAKDYAVVERVCEELTAVIKQALDKGGRAGDVAAGIALAVGRFGELGIAQSTNDKTVRLHMTQTLSVALERAIRLGAGVELTDD